MKAAILQCDDIHDKFLTEFSHYPAMIERMFAQIGEQIEFDTFNCQTGELPTDIHAYDFFITTGSKVSVYDGLAWVDDLVRFIQRLDQQQKTLIGICFGHQLIAIARGLKVEKSSRGWGIGIATNDIVSRKSWMDDSLKKLNILVSHQDQIKDLPSNVEVIASSDFCPYFVLQWSPTILSIQGHPEWINAYSAALMDFRRSRIPAERIEQGFESLSQQADNEVFTRWIMNFVRCCPANHDLSE